MSYASQTRIRLLAYRASGARRSASSGGKRLPARRAGLQNLYPEPAGALMTAAKLRDRAILIVEDEFLIALEASEILEGCGATIIGPAYRIQEALALIQASQVDMALLDVNLHGELSEPVVSAL